MLTGVCAPAEEPLAARVIVLANSNDPDSVALAHHYAEKRAVPAGNIIALPMPAEETIGWSQFAGTVYQPLQEELIRRGWITAIRTSVVDRLGRNKCAISGHRISYLVVCRGVPLRVGHDPELYVEMPPQAKRVEFRTNCGAVDSELALLAQGAYAINAFIPNPLFSNDHASFLDEAQVVKVSRLDGPTPADAAALVDSAVVAERNGLIGRAYVDIGGPDPDGDRWLETTARELTGLGFDSVVDRKPGVFPATARFDAPALYFGWYAADLTGPFAQPGFRFPPGAIALHIHSFSAATLRSDRNGWCGPLLARGVTATFGNVYEPYLAMTHRPDLLLRALVAGRTLGDAAYYALPVLSWQAVMIGDPLYRPFVQPLVEQWRHRAELPAGLFPYVVSRELGQMEKNVGPVQAGRAGAEALRERTDPVLALRVAQLLQAGGDPEAALRALEGVPWPEMLPSALVPVAGEIAQFYADHGAADKAVVVFRRLLGMETLTAVQRQMLLPPAAEAALRSGDAELAALWTQARQALSGLHPAETKK